MRPSGIQVRRRRRMNSREWAGTAAAELSILHRRVARLSRACQKPRLPAARDRAKFRGTGGRGAGMSSAITQGIRISVITQFLPDRSSPDDSRYAFSYTVRIANEGADTAQLMSRHWIITDANGQIEE